MTARQGFAAADIDEGVKNMWKKNLVSLVGAMIIAGLTVSAPAGATQALTSSASAAENDSSAKEESVYGILNSDGSVRTVYVVNTFPAGGQITDYGDYTDVRNLTGTQEILRDGDVSKISNGDTSIRYQGTLQKTDLPWNIQITYALDGASIAPADLAGKSGVLAIRILVTENAAADPFFYDHYALQASLALDTALCTNISSPGATAVDAGGKRQLAYTVLPGKGADVTVTADVKDFEMDAITVNGIRLNLDFDLDTTVFTDQLTDLKDAVTKLDEGADQLASGAEELSSGHDTFTEGLYTFSNGLSGLPAGGTQLKDGILGISDGLSQLSTQGTQLTAGADAIEKATFDQVNAQIAQLGLGLPVLDRTNYSTVLSGIPNLAPMLTTLTQTVQFTDGVKGYVAGVTQIQTGSAALATGAGQLTDSLTTVSASANEIYAAAKKLNEAIATLSDGISEYAAGTDTFAEKTNGIDEDAKAKIDDLLASMTGGNAAPISFASPKNTDILAVQFLLKTDAIQIVQVEEPQPVTKQLTFWDRLAALFSVN